MKNGESCVRIVTFSLLIVPVIAALGSDLTSQADGRTQWVKSKDGTPIAFECGGTGPRLVIVHGGIGDHTRWKPLFPFFAPHFRVCAMDRRGHGMSGDSLEYTLQREAEDVAAVVNSQSGPVFLLGHSYGGICALEATFLTDKISKLVLYEPPLQERNRKIFAARMEGMIQKGQREQALVMFLQEIVMMSPNEVAAMKSRPSWAGIVVSIESQIRQIRALDEYRFDASRISKLKVPTLVLTGSRTQSADLKRAIGVLMGCLPNPTLVVLEGQEHNAMDTVAQQFAETVISFLLDNKS